MAMYGNLLYLGEFFLKREILQKSCRAIKIYFVFSNLFFCENRTVYEIMLKNMVESDR